MATRKLAVVTADTKAPKRRRATTVRAAAERSERDLLVMMRTKVASEIDAGVPAHTLAPLMRQLREIDKDIRALDARYEYLAGRAEEAERSEPTRDETWSAV